MPALRIARLAAVAALVAWLLKAVAIGVAGGLDQSPLEGPLFLVGLLLFVTAVVAFAVAVTAGRPIAVRVGSVAVAVVASLVLTASLVAVGGLLPESAGWVRSELNLWVVSTLIVVLAFWWPQRTTQGRGRT